MRLPSFNFLKRGNAELRGVEIINAATPAFRGPLIAPYNESQARINSVVAACLRWSLDNITEPPLIVEEDTDEGWKQVESPGWDKLMGSPLGSESKDYGVTQSRIIQLLTWSLNLDGNAYTVLHKNERGGLIGVMPVKHSFVTPQYDSNNTKITGYRIGANTYTADSVIHFRRGLDPQLPMTGEAPLKSVMRQVLTDNEIATYQHRIVQSPTPGIMIVVKGNITAEERERLADMAKAKFSGDSVGKPFIAEGDVTMQSVGWSPAEIAIDKLARLPEERITAAFGLPAMTIGVGAGIERSTYDNFRASMHSAVINHLDPIWVEIEQTLTLYLLPLVDSKPRRRVRFDRSKVAALQEDTNAKYERVTNLFKADIIDRQKALLMLGEPYTPEDAGIYHWMLAPQAQILPASKDVAIRSRLSNPLGLS